MQRTVKAIIEADGTVHLLETVHLKVRTSALVTILDGLDENVSLTALLSESALAEDWSRPEEDAAWSHLQSDP